MYLQPLQHHAKMDHIAPVLDSDQDKESYALNPVHPLNHVLSQTHREEDSARLRLHVWQLRRGWWHHGVKT